MKRVVVTDVAGYGLTEVTAGIARILDRFGGLGALVSRGDKVLLKPNMLSAKRPEAAVTTHPAIVEVLAGMLRDFGCSVLVGDSPGLGSIGKVADASGIREAALRSGASLCDFAETVEVRGETFRRLEIAKAYLEADAVINLPKLKTHEMMTLTCAVKNLFGTVVGTAKAGWHLKAGTSREQFAQLLIDIARIRPVAFNLVDAVIAMEGNGPGSGDPIHLGKLIGGDMFAVDVVAARLAGLPAGLLWVEKEATRRGISGSMQEEIELVGADFSNLCLKTFRLPSGMDTRFGLPGFLADLLKHQLSARPVADKVKCILCGVCRDVCPPAVITINENALAIDHGRCIRCWCCRELCPHGAMEIEEGRLLKILKSFQKR